MGEGGSHFMLPSGGRRALEEYRSCSIANRGLMGHQARESRNQNIGRHKGFEQAPPDLLPLKEHMWFINYTDSIF